MEKVKTFRQPRNLDDNQYLEPIINTDGRFFCCACLQDQPKDDQSADPRYCLNCFDSLTYEASQLKERDKRPFWVPTAHAKLKISRIRTPTPTTPLPQNMSTLKSQKTEVDIIQPRPTTTLLKRGPKKLQLPEIEIRQLAFEGMGSKAIATRIKQKKGVDVSYKTVQRFLATIDKPARSILARKGENGCELGFDPKCLDPAKGYKIEKTRVKARK